MDKRDAEQHIYRVTGRSFVIRARVARWPGRIADDG
jgi:hypothetical protein